MFAAVHESASDAVDGHIGASLPTRLGETHRRFTQVGSL